MDPTTFRMMSGATAPPVLIAFTASTYYPDGNASTTLSWQVDNALSVSINQGIGAVANPSSTTQTGNDVTRTYTLSAVGLNGITYSSSLTIYWAYALTCMTYVSHPQLFNSICPLRPDRSYCQPICS